MNKKLDTAREISGFLQTKLPRTYELARRWEETGGREGIPCIRLGKRQLRFDRFAVDAFVNRMSQDGKEGENDL